MKRYATLALFLAPGAVYGVVELPKMPLNTPVTMGQPPIKMMQPSTLTDFAPKKGEISAPLMMEKKEPTDPNLMDFTFQEEDLAEVIKRYAEKKGVNIMMPQGVQSLNQKVTYNASHLFTLEEAERYLSLFLSLAGYALRPGPDGYNVVMKNDLNARRNPLPLYINVAPKLLPNTDDLIRAVYYLSNLKVQDGPDTPLMTILRETVSNQDGAIITDAQLNGFILTDKSLNIRAAMDVLYELDAAGPPYVLETVQLYNSNASYVANYLKTQILALGPQQNGIEEKPGIGTYFSKNIRVVPDTRRNTLIIMGREAPVNRLKQFIKDPIDAPIETGTSVFHVYDLKYRDAQNFAEVLKRVVQGSSPQQDQMTMGQRAGGPRRFFEGVVIQAEVPQQAQQQPLGDQITGDQTGGGAAPPSYRGANRLLVAAQPADWAQLKKLIDKLDVPQRQVILEVLIIDYTRTPVKQLQSRIREPHRLRLSSSTDLNNRVQAQGAQQQQNTSGQVPGIIPTLNNANPPVAVGIDGDLLQVLTSISSTTSAVNFFDPGSMVVSLNDPDGTGIWGLLQVLDSVGNAKVLDHPYLIVLDNTNALVSSSDIRRNTGEGAGISGGVRVNTEDIPAAVELNITPHISSPERLNLDIKVNITEFTSAQTTVLDRKSRSITTNTNLGSGQLLILGGLTRTIKVTTVTQTPILSKIPVFGWFFRSTSTTVEEAELGIFIRPTILEPKIQKPTDEYTKDKIEINMGFEEDITGNRMDPVVRLFFDQDKGDDISPEYINDYFTGADTLPKSEIKKQENKSARLRRRRRKCIEVDPEDPSMKECKLTTCQINKVA